MSGHLLHYVQPERVIKYYMKYMTAFPCAFLAYLISLHYLNIKTFNMSDSPPGNAQHHKFSIGKAQANDMKCELFVFSVFLLTPVLSNFRDGFMASAVPDSFLPSPFPKRMSKANKFSFS